jgi:hypothetical protein
VIWLGILLLELFLMFGAFRSLGNEVGVEDRISNGFEKRMRSVSMTISSALCRLPGGVFLENN